MTDATSLTPPSPGLSATLFPNKNVEPYSPRGPQNVNIHVTIVLPFVRLLYARAFRECSELFQRTRLNVAMVKQASIGVP